MRRGRADEIRQIVRALFQIFEIENPFRQPAEKSQVTVLRDRAARTEQRRGRIEFAAERATGRARRHQCRAAGAVCARMNRGRIDGRN